MKIILCENVENLGSVGDVVKVRDGYARNFLIPAHQAVVATDGNIKVIERDKAEEIKKERENRAEAEKLAETIQSKELKIEMESGDEGKLFGSVTANELHKLLADAGIDVDKKQIRLARPIRKIGFHDFEVRCYNNVKAHVKVNVFPKGGGVSKAALKKAVAAAKEKAEKEQAEKSVLNTQSDTEQQPAAEAAPAEAVQSEAEKE